MKSSIRNFFLAAFAAATILATAHSASAQIYSSNASGDHQLGYRGTPSVMVLALPYAGTYMLGGQQMIVNTGSQTTLVGCWISTTNGGSSAGVPYGPESGATAAPGAVVTIPLGGSYSAPGPTDLWVVCSNDGPSASAIATSGNITAMLW